MTESIPRLNRIEFWLIPHIITRASALGQRSLALRRILRGHQAEVLRGQLGSGRSKVHLNQLQFLLGNVNSCMKESLTSTFSSGS